MQTESSAVVLVEGMLRKAIACGASDIHCHPTDHGLRIRYRIDGILHDEAVIEKGIMLQIISRLKVLSHLDITEKRIPQDGKCRFIAGERSIDLRLSTFPSLYGEKVVIRILDHAATMISLDNLGLPVPLAALCKKLACRSSGFFLATGPTGSGKTTTLYAALAAVSSPEKNIITLEDPIEYNIPGITQGQINPDVGFTFEKGMRALLRQDPDVVMVGEIRDRQTAHIAIEAALTGHLVLSTLHTHDAPSAIMRLMDMGVEPFLINAAVTGVLAQRLARKICTACHTMRVPTQQEQALLDYIHLTLPTTAYGSGCQACFGLGYKGRIGIFELLSLTPALRALIGQQPSFDAIYAQARKDGMKTLLEDGIDKVKQGIISLSELARVLL